MDCKSSPSVFNKDLRPFDQCIVEFFDTSAGREKFYRFIQYYAKFIVPLIKDKKNFFHVTQLIQNLGAVCNLTRKVKLDLI